MNEHFRGLYLWYLYIQVKYYGDDYVEKWVQKEVVKG